MTTTPRPAQTSRGCASAPRPTPGASGSPTTRTRCPGTSSSTRSPQAGYQWIELGPYGYLPTDPARLQDELGRRGLQLSGGAVFAGLHRGAEAYEQALEDCRTEATLLAALGASHLVLLPEQYTDMHSGGALEPRRARAGAVERPGHRRCPRSARSCRRSPASAGLPPARRQPRRHPAAGRAVPAGHRPELVSLCLDTGHISYCGGDNLEIIRAFPDRIGYVHLKQVDPRSSAGCARSRCRSPTRSSSARWSSRRPASRRWSPCWRSSAGSTPTCSRSSSRTCTPASPTCRSRWRRAPAPTSGCGLGPAPTSMTSHPRAAGAPPLPRQKEGIMKPGPSRKRTTMLVATTAVLAAGLAACSGGGAPRTSSEGSGAAGGGGNSGYTFAMITHETPGDTFWDRIKAGAQQAAKDTGSTLKYSADPDATKQAVLIQNAIDSKVDGIATTLVTPDALIPPSRRRSLRGFRSTPSTPGSTSSSRPGSITHFASDERFAGQAVAREGRTGPRRSCAASSRPDRWRWKTVVPA